MQIQRIHQKEYTRLGSEAPGAGSDNSCLPTGDGAVTSHSTPLEPRSDDTGGSGSLHFSEAAVPVGSDTGAALSFVSPAHQLHSGPAPVEFSLPVQPVADPGGSEGQPVPEKRLYGALRANLESRSTAVTSHSTPLEPRSDDTGGSGSLHFSEAAVPVGSDTGAALSFVSPAHRLHSGPAPVEFSLPVQPVADPGGSEGQPVPEKRLYGALRANLESRSTIESPVYPESIAQSHTEATAVIGDELGLQAHFSPAPFDEGFSEDEHQGFNSEGIQLTLICPRWGIVGQCDHPEPHYFVKELICNREWCPGCGGDGGKAHLRRTANKLPKARQLETMGKFVFTVPPEVRHLYRDPKSLSELGVSLKRMLQDRGFDRGIRRFHFFGEDHQGPDGASGKSPIYHPHLEVIVESGYVAPKLMHQLRRGVARILGVNLARVNLHYDYSSEVGKKLHMLRYMLRPTFEKYEWDRRLAHDLVGFKNAVSWGKWHQKIKDPDTGRWINGDFLPPVWDIPEGETKMSEVPVPLQHGFCPVDGTQITWGETMAANLLTAPWLEVGGGYWCWGGKVGIRAGPSSAEMFGPEFWQRVYSRITEAAGVRDGI